MIIIYRKDNSKFINVCSSINKFYGKLRDVCAFDFYKAELQDKIILENGIDRLGISEDNIIRINSDDMREFYGYIEVNNKPLARDIVNIGVKQLIFNESGEFIELILNSDVVLNIGLLSMFKD